MSIPIEHNELVHKFEHWLDTQLPSDHSTIKDFQVLIMCCMSRLRSTLKLEEVQEIMPKLLRLVEHKLQTDSFRVLKDGTKVPILLAEHWRDIPDGHAMIQEIANPNIPDIVPEEWLNA